MTPTSNDNAYAPTRSAAPSREDLTEIRADVADDADRNTLSGKAFQNGNSVGVGNPRIRFQHTLVQRFGVTGHRQTGCPQNRHIRLAVQPGRDPVTPGVPVVVGDIDGEPDRLGEAADQLRLVVR